MAVSEGWGISTISFCFCFMAVCSTCNAVLAALAMAEAFALLQPYEPQVLLQKCCFGVTYFCDQQQDKSPLEPSAFSAAH